MTAHAERAHAKLSASGSKRWLSCPGSIRMEDMFPEDRSSEFAEEGTAAHELSELDLRLFLERIELPDYEAMKENFIDNCRFFSQEMEDHVQRYLDIVIERINEARSKTPDAKVILEERLDFSPWTAPGQFGTGDVLIIADGMMEVIDLKYGKGVPVSAEDNSQMRLYGLGAINGYGFLYDIQTVRMTIVQPRLDSVSTEEMTTDALLNWAEEVVKPGAEEALSGKGKIAPGDHCKFCTARNHCKARAMYFLELDHQFGYKDPNVLTIEEIAEILKKADALKTWAGEVKDFALEQAENGVRFPGWKLVEGRSNRTFTDKDAVADTLVIEGYETEKIYKPKELFGITELEKNVGKKQFTALLGDFIIKPSGKPTLVEESDKRAEISSVGSAQADFADEPE